MVSLAVCGMAASMSQGCGVEDRPTALDNVVPGQSSGGAPNAGVLEIDASTNPPMCNLGPEGGVCACADEPLLVDVPNLYFVLDRSGSMQELDKWQNVQLVLESLTIALGPRASVGAAVFPNPEVRPNAIPMPDSCMPGVEVLPPQQGDAPAGTPGPVEARLPEVLSRVPAWGGTPTAATLQSLLPRLTSLPGKTYVILATDGGPNCNASAMCSADQCTVNIEGTCQAGITNCCLDNVNGGPDACLDAQPTIAAVTQIAAAGIPVYVVGVPGSAPYATLLDELAQAGGTARGSEPQYYAIDSADQAALDAALSTIAAKITGSCTLNLDNLPPDPGLVNVFLDEHVLPQDGPDGWMIDGSTVTIGGASCQKILNGDVLDVRIVAGCPTVTL